MDRRTLGAMRDCTESLAHRQGHRLRKWRRDGRRHFRFTSRCEDCEAWVEVTNQIHTPDEAQRAFLSGVLIAQDAAPGRTDHDYIIGTGEALISRCKGW
jgi:hypothetical protein